MYIKYAHTMEGLDAVLLHSAPPPHWVYKAQIQHLEGKVKKISIQKCKNKRVYNELQKYVKK